MRKYMLKHDQLTLQAYTQFRFEAVDGEHPNKLPFSGVLTKVDEPSDKPPSGAQGHRVMIPKDVAQSALPSLIGMAVDVSNRLEDHDDRFKIGVITDAQIQGNDIVVAGHLFAKDFEREVHEVRQRSRNGELGMSYEIAQVAVEDPTAPIWVIRDLTFTGAAILKRKSAAYESTSLIAAKAAQESGLMTKSRNARKKTSDAVDALLEVQSELQAMEQKSGKDGEGEVNADGEKPDGDGVNAEKNGDGKMEANEALFLEAALSALKRASGMKRMKSMDDIFTAMEVLHSAKNKKEFPFKKEEDDKEENASKAGADNDQKAEGKDKVEAGGRNMKSNILKKMMNMLMDHYGEMEEYQDGGMDEDDDDVSMLRKLVERLETKNRAGGARAARDSDPKVAALEATVDELKAQNELITDMMKTMTKLLTDSPATKKGLATDDKGRRAEDGKPVRKTFAAKGDYERICAQGQLEEGKEYTVAEVDQALDAAHITDPRQRIAFKHQMGELVKTG